MNHDSGAPGIQGVNPCFEKVDTRSHRLTGQASYPLAGCRGTRNDPGIVAGIRGATHGWWRLGKGT